MRLAALAVVLGSTLATVPAMADPCTVTIARAPDTVRAVIDHWVAAEPRCGTALEVQIVETTAGLHVSARDDRGREHDRVVPDAQTAGVLIASWAADDTVTLQAPAHVTIAPPSMASVLGSEAHSEAPASGVLSINERRWIRLGFVDGLATAMLSPEDNISYQANSRGVRASAGVWTRGGWTLDASLELVASHPVNLGRPAGDLKVDEYTAVASFGYALRSGQVSLTPSLGLGARYATFYYSANAAHTFNQDGMMVVEQLSLLGALDLTDRVQATLGMTVVFHPDPWDLRQNMELVWGGGLGWAM